MEWPEAGLLLLNMKHNRWCGNIGRAHRSNGTFYVISLQACFLPSPPASPHPPVSLTHSCISTVWYERVAQTITCVHLEISPNRMLHSG